MTEDECTRCGFCCQNLIIPLEGSATWNLNINKEWMKARGIQVVHFRKLPSLLISSICPHFQFRPDLGVYPVCDIYSERPKICCISGCPKKSLKI